MGDLCFTSQRQRLMRRRKLVSSKMSPLAVFFPWNPGPYHDAAPTYMFGGVAESGVSFMFGGVDSGVSLLPAPTESGRFCNVEFEKPVFIEHPWITDNANSTAINPNSSPRLEVFSLIISLPYGCNIVCTPMMIMCSPEARKELTIPGSVHPEPIKESNRFCPFR